MRIVLLTRSGRPAGAIMAKEIIGSKNNLVGIIVENRFKRKRNVVVSLINVINKHGFEFVVSKIAELIYIKVHTFLYRVFRIENIKKRNYLAIKEVVYDYQDIPCFFTQDINSTETVEFAMNLRPDVIVVSNAGIFKKEIISVPRNGCVNLHMGMLPKYRGLDTIFWALYNNEKKIGVTVHFVDEGVDTGDIILEKTIQVDPEDTEKILSCKARKLGVKMMIEALEQIEKGTVEIISQTGEGKCYGWPTKKERMILRERLNR